MINSIDTYRECGTRAGRAMRQHDESTYRFENDWFRRALRLEQEGPDRIAAGQAYDEAFRAANPMRAPEYFK